jgi:hypothetical protein
MLRRMNKSISSDPLRIYIAGSLANGDCTRALASKLRNYGWHVFDDWLSSGPDADTHAYNHYQSLGLEYDSMLLQKAVKNTFNFDKKWIDWCDVFIMYHPCGKSAHIELGYASQKKITYVLFPERWPDRLDVMYNFADGVFCNADDMCSEIMRINCGTSICIHNCLRDSCPIC